MKEEEFRTFNGIMVGRTKIRGNDLIIYDMSGIALGRYDGTWTYKMNGLRVGKGNLLVLFIKDKFDI